MLFCFTTWCIFKNRSRMLLRNGVIEKDYWENHYDPDFLIMQ